MAAVTAAVVAGVATVAATGASIAQSQGAFGGGEGGGGSPSYGRAPMDPHQRAMRDYFARMTVENVDKTYPGFGDFLESGGDPEKAKFDLTLPGMKPSEAAAIGLTGGRGEAIPYYDASQGEGALSPEQTLYLAKERQRRAKETGGKTPPNTWAEAQVNAAARHNRLTKRQAELEAMPDRTRKQERFLATIPERLEGIKERNPKIKLGGA